MSLAERRQMREERKKAKQALKKQKRLEKERQKEIKDAKTLMRNSDLHKVAPTKGYIFHSDFFQIEDGYGSKENAYATILQLIVDKSVARGLEPLWGIRLFPQSVLPHANVTVLNHFGVMSKQMAEERQAKAEEAVEQDNFTSHRRKGGMSNKITSEYKAEDFRRIANDLTNNGRYVEADFRLLVQAPTLEDLEDSLAIIEREFESNKQGAFTWVAREGEQWTEFSNVLVPPYQQSGKSLGFGSENYAGSYNLVSHGVSDMYGRYFGKTLNELTTAPVLFDIDGFDRHVVIGANGVVSQRSKRKIPVNTRYSTLWGVSLMQTALADGHRVVSFVLDDSHPNKLGIDLSSITLEVQMNQGAINPLEVFGDPKHQLAAYAPHEEVLKKMLLQLDPELNSYDLNELFSSALRDFYTNKNMWKPDAKDREDELRLVGLPHKQYPIMSDFLVSLKSLQQTAEFNNSSQSLKGYSHLVGAMHKLVDVNGDLFDKRTVDSVDDSREAPNVIYNFNNLMERGQDVAMAQLINVFGYATSVLGRSDDKVNDEGMSDGDGDLVIIYGAEQLDPKLFSYFKNQFHILKQRGVRVAWVYNNTDIMVSEDHAELTGMRDADYTICGSLRGDGFNRYEDLMRSAGFALPSSVERALPQLNDDQFFLRRGGTSLLFEADFVIDTDTGIGDEIRSSK